MVLNSLNRHHLFKHSAIAAIFRINFIIAVLWGTSLLLEKVGIPYLLPLFGTLALFAPGFCLSLLIEQLSESKTKIIILLIWSALFTFVITPAAVFGLSQLLFQTPPIEDAVTPFLIWWGMSFLLTSVVTLIKHQSSTVTELSLDHNTKRELRYIVGGYVAIMIINFIVYPLLPEGDGYSYLVKWNSILANPKELATESRPLFLIFVNTCGQLLKIDPYWVFKILLPISHITLVLSCYIFLQNFITESRYRIMLALSPLFFPIILQESLISRPQSILLISFLPSIVIISEVLGQKKNFRQIYWLMAMLVIGVFGIKIHTLFILIALISLVSVIIFLRREVAKRPIDSIIIGLGLLALILPQLSSTRILPDSWRVLEIFIGSFRLGQLDLWFIDHYRNVDGIELGWPGLLSLFYYGYDLGLVFPALFILLIFQKQLGTFKLLFREKYWAVIFLFAFFFFIAEIGPRFQVAYLPDRAWLFVALLFALVLPVMVTSFNKNGNTRFFIFLAILSFLSIAVSTGLTYAKQGWVTTDEVAAAPFIRENTPENAIILAQGGTRMMVRYYTKRTSIRPDDAAIFLTGEKSALETYLKNEEVAYQEALAVLPKRKAEVENRLNEIAHTKGKIELTDEEEKGLLESLSLLEQQKNNYFTEIERLNELYPTVRRPVYLMYNQNKFNTLYGRRGWWRSSNFYGANLEQLNANYPIIYNKNGITIWESRK